MKDKIRHTIVAFLLAGMLMPVLLFIFSYNIQQKKIKKEVKKMMIAGIADKDLVHFYFDLASNNFLSLKWKHSKEFEYKGNMFDIVKADTVKNIAHYICFPDKQETALNKMFVKQLNDYFAGNKEHEKRQVSIQHFVCSFYCSNFNTLHYGFPNKQTINIVTHFLFISQFELNYTAPPPKYS